jgi:hypothetical protein
MTSNADKNVCFSLGGSTSTLSKWNFVSNWLIYMILFCKNVINFFFFKSKTSKKTYFFYA